MQRLREEEEKEEEEEEEAEEAAAAMDVEMGTDVRRSPEAAGIFHFLNHDLVQLSAIEKWRKA